MSTNATLRNNLAKRGTNILCGNNVNKEKELIPVQKKSSILNQAVLNGNNSNFNSNSLNNQSTSTNLTNNGKNAFFSKLDPNKAKIASKKENNENDKNANNVFLKRKTTIDFENNAKKQMNSLNYNNNNNSFLLNNNNEKEQIRISVKNQNSNLDGNSDMNMNVSMKDSNRKQQMSENTEMATEEANTGGYVLTNNNNINNIEFPKTHRNSVIVDPKRSSMHLASSETSQIITKSLLHGEIKKRPIIANANANNNTSNNNIITGNCEEFAFEAVNAENSQANSSVISNIPNTKQNSMLNNNNNNNGPAVNQIASSIQNQHNSSSNLNTNNKLNFKSLISGISLNNTGSTLNIPASLYSFNLENVSISKELAPKFTNEEYRRMFTRLIRKDLGRSYVHNLFQEEEQMDDFLLPHKVTERMRTRMIDWMIEVLTNYKCDDNTFFIAVNTMDRYFKAFSGNAIQPAELHLLGVAAMFMASKYEDIYPLRLKIVHEKIAHKKLSCQEIKEKETDISVNLGFILGKPTQWDFINFFIEEIFFTQVNNFAVQDKTLCENYGTAMGTGPNPSSASGTNSSLLQNFSQYETEIFKNYTPNMINLLRHVVVYLAKMNCHDYSLSGKKPSLIAASTIFVAMKICEQINKEEYVNEYFSKKLTEISQKNENEIIKTAQKILYNAQNFDSIFSGLENLKKIHFNAIIDLKNTK